MSKRQPPHSNAGISIFVVALCFACAIILAVMATVLRAPIQKAEQLDYAKQLLITAKILDPKGYFLMLPDQKGDATTYPDVPDFVPAVWDQAKGMLVQSSDEDKASPDEIYEVYEARLKPYVTDSAGKVQTFKQAGIDDPRGYIESNRVTGYATLPEKLFYEILPNYSTVDNPTGKDLQPAGFIIPVAGFGLWGPIYGYIALEPDADTVIGTTWVAPQETPGLGAEIQFPAWQSDFYGKKIFHESADGKTDFKSAPLGITVVKGKVSEVYGSNAARAASAVDGVSGATLTGDGVTAAYSASLEPYRAFLIEAHDKDTKGSS